MLIAEEEVFCFINFRPDPHYSSLVRSWLDQIVHCSYSMYPYYENAAVSVFST